MKRLEKCPSCLANLVIWQDTNHRNESDQGTGRPYVMCEDQEVCGLIMSVRSVDKLRELYRKINT